jgi:hypothetical protein
MMRILEGGNDSETGNNNSGNTFDHNISGASIEASFPGGYCYKWHEYPDVG